MSKHRLTTLRPRVPTLGQRTTTVGGWNADGRGSRHQRGYGSAWERIRKEVLDRDAGLCQPCWRAGRYTRGRAVDHIIPRNEGGTDDPSNLEVICARCHAIKTQAESVRARGGP